ncbi:CoA-binding protein [Natrialba asiatica]|uniref:acetate--CoA ligase (ADP-forming) n=1 Tax=Natrialba asiatica (strain ATCC 700177 / DSM 12278 / JCM 9576 / FERM P-10747 / NBRC 102637 / 172P1) TaxID=29540 RepID=M0B427_NATA1|nr:CoA-binding protein [Natrialba asiatica]ELZ05297.1 CoA-binding protein [Natrialba asiatica DSM 12278]
MSLPALFDPDGVAVIGASATPGKLGNDAMSNVEAYGTEIYPVNPSSSGTVFGYEFVDSVRETDAELALCCVPRHLQPDVIEECGEAGVEAAVIFAGGFAEMGGDGAELQHAIAETAAAYDMTVLGPNTAGYAIPHEDLYGSFVPRIRDVGTGNVGLVTQSAGVGITMSFQLTREGYGISAMFGLGNRMNTGFADVIPALDDDPRTDAIVMHVEGTDDVDALLRACQTAETPIAAFKVGEHDIADLARAHTAAPAQDNAIYEAGFDQPGLVTVSSTTELLDAGRALADSPTPDGPNVGLVTAQAGPGIIMTDFLKGTAATFPDLTDETRKRLDEILPGITYAENPVDTGRPMPEFGAVIDAVARDDNVDIVLVYEIYEDSLGYPVDELETLSAEVDKPICFTVAGPDHALEDERRQMEAAGVPTFDTPERGAQAVGALLESISGAE